MKDFPLIRSVRSAVLSVLLIAGPILLFAFSPLMGLYAGMAVLFLLPTLTCISGLVGGMAPFLLNAGAGLFAMAHLFGGAGLSLAALYLLPILAAFLCVIAFRAPFWKGCAVMVGVHVLSLAAVYAVLRNLAGGDLYAAAGQAAMDALRSSELGDSLLYQLYSMGLIGLRGELAENALQLTLGGYALSSQAREDLLLSVNTLVSSTLVTLVPNVIVTQSILGGVMCLLLPLRFGFLAEEKRAFLSRADADAPQGKINFPDLGMPPFSAWHLPRGIGWQVGAALIAGYLLRMSAAPAAAVAGSVLHAGASAVFMIQGAALVNFLQKSRGTRRVWRVVTPIVLMLLSVLMMIGVVDQMVNIRGLRKPREPKEGI